MVNTGWNGENNRISLPNTRLVINSILNGDAGEAAMSTLPIFKLSMPAQLNGLDVSVLDPRASWESDAAWAFKATELAHLFTKNFIKFTDTPSGMKISKAGPVVP